MWYSNLLEQVILKETYENIKYSIFSYFQSFKLFSIIVIKIYTVDPWKTQVWMVLIHLHMDFFQ